MWPSISSKLFLGCYTVDVDDVADVSELRVASTFRVEMYMPSVLKRSGGRRGR
jgi:hypothetical protein